MRMVIMLTLLVFSASAQQLSLKGAQKRLLADNLEILAAQEEVRKAQAGVTEARSDWYPSLDASASYSYISEKGSIRIDGFPSPSGPVTIDKEIGQNDKTELGLDLSYPIFTGFSRGHAHSGKREAVAVKQAEFEVLKNQLAFSLGLLYLQWQFSYRQADIRRTLIEQLEAHAGQVANQREAGTVLKSRLLDAQARLELARVDLQADSDRCDSLRRELLTLINGDEATIEPTNDSPIGESSRLPAKITTDRPELMVFDRRKAEIEESKRMIAGRYYPSLVGIAGYRYGNPGLNMGYDEFMGYGLVGARLKWNIFDGFRKRAQMEQLNIAEQQLDLARRGQVDRFERMFEDAGAQLASAEARLAATKRAHEAARALAEEMKDLFEAGMVTSAEQLNSVTAERQAALLVEQAKTARQVAVLRVMYSAGEEIVY